MKASCVQSFDFRETKYQSHFQSLSELLLTVACPLFPLNKIFKSCTTKFYQEKMSLE